MGRESRAATLLPLLLTLLMILPSILSVAASESSNQNDKTHSSDVVLFSNNEGKIMFSPDLSDPSHGWNDGTNIGEAYLFYRTANYVPINDWFKITNERVMDGWYVLAHDYPVPSNWKESLADAGINCFSYLPPQGFHCYVSEMSPADLEDRGVIGSFQLDAIDKIAPDIIPILNGVDYGQIQEGTKFSIYLVLSGEEQIENLLSNGITISSNNSRLANVYVTEEEIKWLLDQPFVEWLEPQYPTKMYDDVAAGIIHSDLVWDSSYMGSGNELSGDGIIIAIADTGLDNAVECDSLVNCNALNPSINSDFAGRIVEVVNGVCTNGGIGDGNPGDTEGHGTHVAGSALGDGSNSDGQYKGMAFDSKLWFYSAYHTSGCIGGAGLWTPPDTTIDSLLFQPAYDAGARIHSNSWGNNPSNSAPNYYNVNSLAIDQASYDYDDMVILFALGNEGKDENLDGKVDTSWIQGHAVSKNGFSIGASENYRPNIQSLCGDQGFLEEPIENDYLSDNSEGVACFSNRGPANDGRIKPDLVAPGTFIISVASSLDTVHNTLASNTNYRYSSGTSMATPLTAGSTALLLEYLHDNGYANPSSALIKGIWSSTSVDMQGQYDTPSNNAAVQSIPNNHEGWGRIDIQKAITSSFLDRLEIETSETKSIMMTVPVGVPELRVVLSWTDSPSASVGSCATQCLVNDLDFSLIDPSGNIWGEENGDLNNLLGITVTNPDAGKWEIIVSGTNVPEGPQNFAVAVSGNYMLTDMSQPVSGTFNVPGFQEGSIFTEATVAAGNDHICVILDDSSVNCWGDNTQGQLGDGTFVDRQTMTPVNFGVGRTAVSLSAGDSHSCAILDDASLKCWGDNTQGQLGDNTLLNSNTPVNVDLGSDIPVTISAGAKHTCVVLATANLKCWGDNSDGQLGDGTTNSANTPSFVNLDSNLVLGVSTGKTHTCVIMNNRSLKCWGDNSQGQLGDSTNIDKHIPTTISLGGDPVAISTGDYHTCSLLSDATLSCWGDNSQGQLGDGSNGNSNSPIESIISGITSISLGNSHTCALDNSYQLKCWGDNSFSQLGDGSDSDSNVPLGVSFSGGKFPISISSGGHYTCSSINNDLLRCWGIGGSEPLAIGVSPTDLSIPRWSYINSAERDLDDDSNLNIFDTHIVSDADGDGFPSESDSDDNNPAIAATCGIGEYGRYYCQQATVGFYVDAPGSLIKIPASPGNYVNTNGATAQSPCSIGTFQELSGMEKCDDSYPGYYVMSEGSSTQTACSGGTYNPLSGSSSSGDCIGSDAGHSVPILTDINSGTSHSCAILDDGSIRCWGNNANGQLGDGSRDDRLIPTLVNTPLGRNATSLSTGLAHSCAIFDDHSLRCWGDNSYGQLGDGTLIERILPTSVNLGNGRSAISVSLGQTHTCAILDDNSLKCWGGNANGQLGDESTSDRKSPQSISFGGYDVTSVSAGAYHTCALLNDTSINCWGDNWHGQLGDGSNDKQLTPVSLGDQYQSRSISSGSFHTCAIMINNSLYCWGLNSGGQLGNGDFNNTNVPSMVALSENQITSTVGSGFHHTCVILDVGAIMCWGDNTKGQLGDGTNIGKLLVNEVSIPEGRLALSISVGQRHSCAILDDATLYCWGMNSHGQLGNGANSNRNTPEGIDLNHGSGFQTPCEPGAYQPSAGQTSCILASKGYDVPDAGSLEQYACLIGHYSNINGLDNCIEASLGYYVESTMARDQVECPQLTSTIRTGMNSILDCILDTDGDRIVNLNDPDDDNDGVPDYIDWDPLDPEISADSDNDDIPDNLDPDDDNDGVNDTYILQYLDSDGNLISEERPLDIFPYDNTEWSDTDSDGRGDNSDDDDDDDGRSDNFDTFPSNQYEWSDYDGDELGDNFDADDDGDGVCDTKFGTSFMDESNYNYGSGHNIGGITIMTSNGAPVSLNHPSVLAYLPSVYPLIYPSDLVALSTGHPAYMITLEYCNLLGDEYPLDPSEYIDTDGDTLGNNLDNDDDGDGYDDDVDAFQLDPNEWNDTDGDNQGDNFDMFDNDPLEWADSDGDSVGNNADECVFEPGLNSSYSDFTHLIAIGNLLGCVPDPNLNSDGDEGVITPVFLSNDFEDIDDDGIINLLDLDDDGDQILDVEDPFPNDPTRPFDQNVYLLITLIIIFLVVMLTRLINWQKTKIAKFRTKRIHVE